MHLLMHLLPLALLMTTSAALPQPVGKPAADEMIRSSWSAKNIANRAAGPDADEAIRNSWSARTIANRDADADADNLIRNSWSAKEIAN